MRRKLFSSGSHSLEGLPDAIVSSRHFRNSHAIDSDGRLAALASRRPRRAGIVMLKVIISSVFAFFLVGATALAANAPKKPTCNSGLASVYSYGRTARGERQNPTNLAGAHRSLPFGTKVQVTNRRNGRSVVVRINDRGPFIRGRVIDVTPAAARALGFSGLAPVTLDVIDRRG